MFSIFEKNNNEITKDFTIKPHFILSGGNYNNQYVEADKFGYEISTTTEIRTGYKYSGSPQYKCANSKYYMMGDLVYLYSYTSYYYETVTREFHEQVKTIYKMSFWYIASDGSKVTLSNITDKVNIHYWYIDSENKERNYSGYLVKELYPNSTNNTYTDKTELNNIWVAEKTSFKPYISHIKNVSKKLLDSEMVIRNVYKEIGEYIVNYSGTYVANYPYYLESTTSKKFTFNQNKNLKISIDSTSAILSISNGGNFVNSSVSNDMDSILTNAQNNFSNNNYALWYGKLYAYNGNTMYSKKGYIYKPKYIYRIMPNEDNSNFTWVIYSNFSIDTSNNILTKIGSNQCEIGDIFYSTANAFGHFNNGWYRLVLDGNTNTYNLVKYNDISIGNTGNTYSRIKNEKITNKTSDYLGYAGLYDIEISAVIRIKNPDGTYTEKVKRYRLKLLGYRK